MPGEMERAQDDADEVEVGFSTLIQVTAGSDRQHSQRAPRPRPL